MFKRQKTLFVTLAIAALFASGAIAGAALPSQKQGKRQRNYTVDVEGWNNSEKSGCFQIERLIAERLAQELKDYPEWRVTVLGSGNTEILEIKVDGLSGKWFGVRKLDQNNTVERVVKEAMNMNILCTEGREGKKKRG